MLALSSEVYAALIGVFVGTINTFMVLTICLLLSKKSKTKKENIEVEDIDDADWWKR